MGEGGTTIWWSVWGGGLRVWCVSGRQAWTGAGLMQEACWVLSRTKSAAGYSTCCF